MNAPGRNGTGKEDTMFTFNPNRKKPTLCISMQYFADPDNKAEAETNASAENADDAGKEPTFDDVLSSNKAYQSEYDKRVNKALNTARQKWEADAKAQAEEAAKLARMQAAEKAEYERQKREKELSEREAAITKRELHAEAVTQLTGKGLPAGLADILDCTSADACKASMEAVEKAFGEAVEKAVNDRLKGAPPKAGGGKMSEDAFLAGLGVK
jgi:hypothetical protein